MKSATQSLRNIETDPLRLRQILYNLVGNAFKFTDSGSVLLKVAVSGSNLLLEVADDDRSNREVITLLLAELGFAVDEADSGNAALVLMRSGHFDGMISVNRKTGKVGNALCREVRSDQALAKTVMIASSASVYEGDRHDAESAGFDDFLPKPVREGELIRVKVS